MKSSGSQSKSLVYWSIQIAIVFTLSLSFVCLWRVENAQSPATRIEYAAYSVLKKFQSFYDNLKYSIRGEIRPTQKIVILAIDEDALAQYGRWPWPRGVMAENLKQLFEFQPQVVALDIVFAEAEEVIAPGLREVLKERKLEHIVDFYDGDRALVEVISKNRSKLIMGWAAEYDCRPSFAQIRPCPMLNDANTPPLKNPLSQIPTHPTILISSPLPTLNHEKFHEVGDIFAFFNAWPDPDSIIRRTNLVMNLNGYLYPSLALATAAVARGSQPSLEFAKGGGIQNLVLQDIHIPTNARGEILINTAGGSKSFETISFSELDVASEALRPKLKDAIVFVGLTALGLQDIRSFPLGSDVPGVEAHAWMTESILSQRFLKMAEVEWVILVVLASLLTGLWLAHFGRRLGVISAMSIPLGLSALIAILDNVLFQRGFQLDLLFVALQPATLGIALISFRLIEEAREKAFVRNAFGHYLSSSVVNWVLENPDALKLGGKKQELSILFSDIRNFTTFSETQDPERLTAFLNDYMNLMTKTVVDEFHGTLDKYIGDAIMAFWGAPLVTANHAQESVKCAQAMIRALAQARPMLRERYGFDVHIGIGINSGIVTVGNMGSTSNFNYTVIGDPVNLASRVEGLSKVYGAELLITEHTLRQIRDLREFKHRLIDRVRAKGKKEAVTLYQIFADDRISNEALDAFGDAYAKYIGHDFEKAKLGFENANRLYERDMNQPDAAAGLYIKRSIEFMSHPPKDDLIGFNLRME